MEGKTNKRPLATRQVQVLRYLRDMADSNDRLHYPCPPSSIAYGIGMNKLPGITAYKGWSGTAQMNPAQRIISSLTGLRNRGLIYDTRRPDGMSGSAYGITDEGRAVLD